VEFAFGGICGKNQPLNNLRLKNSIYSTCIKAPSDFMAAFVALILFLPVMLLIIILLKLTGHHSFFFVQKRVGKNDCIFNLLKFKTMTDAKNEKGVLLPDAIRLTPFGKWLRKSSLDEIPQLINVIKGDMSLVGPRPLLPEYLPLYSAEQQQRHQVKPGITGWAQVNGRNAISWTKKFELDVWYVKHQHFLLDLTIIFKTIGKIFHSEGISQQGNATMEPFRGE
jgi:lipopolysaccharide/colanic/teichoic acid biosynthesis glycosyltransferase